MPTKCRYGDEESVRVEECNFDNESGVVTCGQLLEAETSFNNSQIKSRQRLKKLEMEVQFVKGDGTKTRKIVTADYDSEDSSDEPLVGTFQREISATGGEKVKRKKVYKFFSYPTRKQFGQALASMIGEVIGTFFLTLIICCAVASAVITGAQSGLWQVAVICGIGVSISIYCTAHFSDAHLNPAITIAFGIVRWKTFSWKKVVPYISAQMLGGILAGGVTYGLFRHAIAHFELQHEIIRGSNTSVLTAMLFGEYFPNPALYDHSVEESLVVLSPVEAMIVEAWATGILAFVIFCFTDQNNTTVGSGGNKVAVPILIGVTVATMISLYGSLTQVGMNPARDFGPRLFAVFAGWWQIAIPGPRNGFWVYIVGPVIGALVGGIFYDVIVANILKFAKASKHKSTPAEDSVH